MNLVFFLSLHPYTEEDALPGLEQESTQHTATFYDLSDSDEQSVDALLHADTSIDVTANADLTKKVDRDLLVDRLWRGEYLADIDAFRGSKQHRSVRVHR